MIKPTPNVLYNSLEEAKKRLYEYNVEVSYKETNRALPGTVFAYHRIEEKNIVHLDVAKAPKESFSVDEKVEYVYGLGFVTGRKSINKDILVPALAGATDLGIPVNLGNRMIYLYGDTFSGVDVDDGYWNSDFIAVSKDFNYLNGLKFCDVIKDQQGFIKPIKQGLHHRNLEENLDIKLGKEVSRIPTGGILIGDDVYIFTMSVRYWGKAGMWYVSHNDCFKANKDRLDKFSKVDSLSFYEEESDRFGQIFPFENEFDKERIYFIAIPGGRRGNASLLRVLKSKFEDRASYELCVGKNKWAKLKEGLKKKPYFILSNDVSEPSIMYNHYLKKWTLACIHMDGLFLYTSSDLTSKFDEERIKILTHKEYVSFYGGFMHPLMSEFDDKKIFIQVSQWSPIYNTSLVEVVFK